MMLGLTHFGGVNIVFGVDGTKRSVAFRCSSFHRCLDQRIFQIKTCIQGSGPCFQMQKG